MTEDSIPVHTHDPPSAGWPTAADWIRHFAELIPASSAKEGFRQRVLTMCRRRIVRVPRSRSNPQDPVNLVRESPVWSGYAATFLFTHQHSTWLPGTNHGAADAEVDRLVHNIDTTIARLVDIPVADVQIGALVSTMAHRWLLYCALPSQLNITGLLKAQRDYNTAIEQLAMRLGSLR